MKTVTTRKAKTKRRESIADAATRLERDALRRRVQRQVQIRKLTRQLSAEVLRTRQALRVLWISLGVTYGDDAAVRHIREQHLEPAEQEA
jgi:hypothetical protein